MPNLARGSKWYSIEARSVLMDPMAVLIMLSRAEMPLRTLEIFPPIVEMLFSVVDIAPTRVLIAPRVVLIAPTRVLVASTIVMRDAICELLDTTPEFCVVIKLTTDASIRFVDAICELLETMLEFWATTSEFNDASCTLMDARAELVDEKSTVVEPVPPPGCVILSQARVDVFQTLFND